MIGIGNFIILIKKKFLDYMYRYHNYCDYSIQLYFFIALCIYCRYNLPIGNIYYFVVIHLRKMYVMNSFSFLIAQRLYFLHEI